VEGSTRDYLSTSGASKRVLQVSTNSGLITLFSGVIFAKMLLLPLPTFLSHRNRHGGGAGVLRQGPNRAAQGACPRAGATPRGGIEAREAGWTPRLGRGRARMGQGATLPGVGAGRGTPMGKKTKISHGSNGEHPSGKETLAGAEDEFVDRRIFRGPIDEPNVPT
jgi:hypothetical protein